MTSADVMWQDGMVEKNIRSNELFPVHHLDNNEFCPGDFVVDKRGNWWNAFPLDNVLPEFFNPDFQISSSISYIFSYPDEA